MFFFCKLSAKMWKLFPSRHSGLSWNVESLRRCWRETWLASVPTWQISQALQIVSEKLINFSFLCVRSDYNYSTTSSARQQERYLISKIWNSESFHNTTARRQEQSHHPAESVFRWDEKRSEHIENLWKIILNNSTWLSLLHRMGREKNVGRKLIREINFHENQRQRAQLGGKVFEKFIISILRRKNYIYKVEDCFVEEWA